VKTPAALSEKQQQPNKKPIGKKTINEKPTNEKPIDKWQWAKRLLTLFLFLLVPVLLFFLLKNVDWQEVKQALQEIKPLTLGLGLAVALLSYVTYGSYDLIGRKYSNHTLPVSQVLQVAFVCYAFTLNLSYLVGGFALRFRLYSRLGLDTATITKVFTLSVITNWLGYMVLAGTIFSFRLVDLPEHWKIGTTGLQVVGCILLLIATIYMAGCRFAKRRSWKIFSHEIELPTFRLAMAQLILACVNWSLMALIIWIFLPDKISYFTTLGILLLCAIAGVISHIPAGLGVLEGIFITLLQNQVPKSVVLAALIGYRVCYFLVPLAIATATYFFIENRHNALTKALFRTTTIS